jgi:YmgG-like glycine-zipper protein
MAFSIARKTQAAALSIVLLMPAGAALANDWSKENSRTKGTVVGAVAGALIGGKKNAVKGAVIGAAVGNATQHVQHKRNPSKKYRERHARYHRLGIKHTHNPLSAVR